MGASILFKERFGYDGGNDVEIRTDDRKDITEEMRITINNPDKLIEIFKNIAPEWVVKYRATANTWEDIYVFGFQNDSSLVWDRFQLVIDRKTQMIHDPYNFKPHYNVKLTFKYMLADNVEITNAIKLDELKDLQGFCGHILDGLTEIIDSKA
jgi:hypothetical protein